MLIFVKLVCETAEFYLVIRIRLIGIIDVDSQLTINFVLDLKKAPIFTNLSMPPT